MKAYARVLANGTLVAGSKGVNSVLQIGANVYCIDLADGIPYAAAGSLADYTDGPTAIYAMAGNPGGTCSAPRQDAQVRTENPDGTASFTVLFLAASS